MESLIEQNRREGESISGVNKIKKRSFDKLGLARVKQIL